MVTIFTNIKNEQRYLKQWIEYHANLGFDEFILFEDEGSEPHDDIVKGFKDIKVLLYKNVLSNDSTIFKDLTCFKYVFQRHPEIEWGIKLDPDEYIELGKFTNIKEYIATAQLKSPIGEIVMPWHLHNANGRVLCPNGNYNLLETYSKEIPFEDIKNDDSLITSANEYKLSKTLLNFNFYYDRSDVTINRYIAPNFPHRLLLTSSQGYDSFSNDGVYIKHFITKSFDEYFNRLKSKGEYSPQWFRTIGDFFVLNPDMKYMIPELEKEYGFNMNTFKTKLNVTKIKYQK